MPSKHRHAALYRVPAHIDVLTCQRNLASALDREPTLFGGSCPRLWVQPVPGAVHSCSAQRHRARELAWRDRSSLRLVLLACSDGVAELVVSARTGTADRTALDRIARVVLFGDLPPNERFDPGPDDVMNDDRELAVDRFTLPDLASDRSVAADVVAALGLALARVTGEPCGGAGSTVAEYRAAVDGSFPDEAGAELRLGGDTVDARVIVEARPRMPESREYVPPVDPSARLTVYVERDGAGGLAARCWHRSDELAMWFVGYAGRAWRELLAGRQDRTLDEIDLVDDQVCRRVVELGRTARPAGSAPDTIHRLLVERASGCPDGVALIDRETRISYAELVERSCRYGHALRALGVAPGDRVGVCLDRSAELVVVLLAVLAVGAAYVPLDPAYPGDRQAFVAADAALGLVITDRDTAFVPAATVSLDQLAERADGMPGEPPAVRVGPDDPAYVIYTSGSTGRPKGVVVPHRNVCRLLAATAPDFAFGPRDTWTWFHSVAFDFSVWEIWGCLLTGGRLVVVPHWTSRSPEDFRALLHEHGVTVLNQTPSAFTQLLELENREPSELALRLVVFGGEPLDAGVLTAWFDIHPESSCRMVNMFGITETTVHVTAQTLSRSDALAGSRSVGRPIPGWSVRILDERRRLLPPGAAGEIAVGGDGLALRYLNRPELTAERFVVDPRTGERLYLSGDRGQLLPDGRLLHLGRLDNQVKLRGHRIELDEIRAVLLEDPDVLAAAVVLNTPDPTDNASARIDAYVVLRAGDPVDVRRRAARTLPDYMVPSAVIALRELPLTTNGKLDVARLPAAEVDPVVLDPVRSDDRESLSVVLAVWRAVFRTGVDEADNFFDLGGNSLLAVRIAGALRDRGIGVGVRDVYANPSPKTLAEFVDRSPMPDGRTVEI